MSLLVLVVNRLKAEAVGLCEKCGGVLKLLQRVGGVLLRVASGAGFFRPLFEKGERACAALLPSVTSPFDFVTRSI